MSNLPSLKDLQFGFELEGVARWPQPVSGSIWKARELYTRGFARRTGLDVAYENKVSVWSPTQWIISGDSSISRDHPREIDIELKSPILQPESLPRLPELFLKCATAGLAANESCGLHLHIGRNGQTQANGVNNYKMWKPCEVAAFMQSFEDNAAAIHTLVSPARLYNGHCKRNAQPVPYNVEWVQQAYKDGNLPQRDALVELSRLYCPMMPLDNGIDLASEDIGDRNYAVNLASLFDKGTIEIKLRQAENYTNATPFIGALLHMAQAAIDGRRFVWNDYMASAANDQMLALPWIGKPRRPLNRKNTNSQKQSVTVCSLS